MTQNNLTSEQEALMLSVIKDWIEVPFNTSLVNKEKAEAAINLTYESLGEKQPEKIIWFDNPFDAANWMIDNLDYLEHPKHFSQVPFNIYWDDMLYNIYQEVDRNIRNLFENNFNKIIHYKYLNWLSQSFLANLSNYYLRNCLLNHWEEGLPSSKHQKFQDIEDYEVHQ